MQDEGTHPDDDGTRMGQPSEDGRLASSSIDFVALGELNLLRQVEDAPRDSPPVATVDGFAGLLPGQAVLTALTDRDQVFLHDDERRQRPGDGGRSSWHATHSTTTLEVPGVFGVDRQQTDNNALDHRASYLFGIQGREAE